MRSQITRRETHALSQASLTRKHERTLRYLRIGTTAFNAADYMLTLLTLLALRMDYRE